MKFRAVSNKQRIVLSIEGAKTSETRQRRIAKAVENLREKKVWFSDGCLQCFVEVDGGAATAR
jgi:uncharacterized protein YdeI (YjbR/CyaY-like superfamily)